MKKKIHIYYHCFLTEDATWVFIILDQLKLMEDTGLLDAADKITVLSIGNKKQLSLYRQILNNYPKINVIEIVNGTTNDDIARMSHNSNSGTTITESETIQRIWRDSHTDDFYAFYLHNKGSTSFNRCLLTDNDADKFRNYYYWRKFLEWGTIEKWRECVSALEENDIAGCNFNGHPFFHFSGNIWWANSSYIRTLDDIKDCPWWNSVKQSYHPDRMIDEFWIGHKAKRIFNLNSPPDRLCSPNPGLYAESYLRKNYEG